MRVSIVIGLFCVILGCCYAHPGRPAFQDNQEARLIFAAAERNRTADGFLTSDELADIFHTFDENDDGQVTEAEFLYIWKDRQLGDVKQAARLFHHADTDKNNVLTQVPDLSRVFYYFDQNRTKLRIFGISNDLSQAKKDKETNNSRHNTTQKTIEQHEPH